MIAYISKMLLLLLALYLLVYGGTALAQRIIGKNAELTTKIAALCVAVAGLIMWSL